MTVSKKGAELGEKPIVEPPELFYPAEFRMAELAAKKMKLRKRQGNLGNEEEKQLGKQ